MKIRTFDSWELLGLSYFRTKIERREPRVYLRTNLHLSCIRYSSWPRYALLLFNRGSKVSSDDDGKSFQRNNSFLRRDIWVLWVPYVFGWGNAVADPRLFLERAIDSLRGREIFFRRARRCTRFHIDRFWFRNSILARTLTRKERTTLRRSLPPVTMDREEIFPITRARRIEDAFTVAVF